MAGIIPYEYRPDSDWEITLACSAMQRNTAKVKVQYPNVADKNRHMTVGTMHLAYERLAVLIRILRKGGARLTITGSFIEAHPELRRIY